MITRIERGGEAGFLQLCDRDKLLGADIRTQLAIYGPDAREADFWLQTGGDGASVAAICRENGRVLIAADPAADSEELDTFLQVVGGYGRIRADADLCVRMSLGGVPNQRFDAPAMHYPGGYSGWDPAGITEDLRLDDLYALLCATFPGFDRYGRERWLVYASHLFRHGLGFAAGLYIDGRLACTGGVYALGPDNASIACVATHPACRSTGRAARVVRYLCDRCLDEGRTPTLLCAEDSLADYYGRLGFVPHGRWGEITLTERNQA